MISAAFFVGVFKCGPLSHDALSSLEVDGGIVSDVNTVSG